MNKGYINWKLVLVLVLGFCAVSVTVVGLRKFNRTQRAKEGLSQGLTAYEDRRWKEAAQGLGQYLGVHQNNPEILLKYGHAQSRIRPFNSDSYNQAVNAYRAVLRLDETNTEAAQALVELYLQSHVPAEAELVASRFLEKQYDSQLMLQQAAAQMMQRKYEEAAQLLTGMLVREPAEVDVYEFLASLAKQRPQLLSKSEMEWIDEAVERNPDSSRAYILRGRFLANSGRLQEARKNLQMAEGCKLSDGETRLKLAAAWLRLNAIEQARIHLDAAFEKDPHSFELWQLRAIAAAKSQDPDEAVRIAREGLEWLGQDKIMYLPYAVELFLLAQDIDSARAAMKELRTADIGGGLICYLDGLLSESEGNWSHAMTLWREAVVQGYNAEPVHLKLAEGAVRLEDRASAIETLRRYITQNPDSVAARILLAQFYYEARQWFEASQIASAAVKLDPSNKEGQTILLRSRIELLSTVPNSQEQVDQLLAELIAHEDSFSNRMQIFRVSINRQDWDKARQILDRLEERYGNTLQLDMARAEYYVRCDEYDEAVAFLKTVMNRFPQAAEPVIFHAAIYVQQGHAEEAITYVETAVMRLDGFARHRAQLWLADMYQQSGRREDAIVLYNTMATDNPRDIVSRRRWLALNRSNGDVVQLQKCIEEIKSIEGETGRLWKIEQVSLWSARGDIKKRYIEAVTLLTENLTSNPDDLHSLMLLAFAHEQAGNMRLAVSLYKEALARHPDDIELSIAALGVMYRAEEYRMADQLLEDLSAAGYTDPRLARLELQSYVRQGQLDSAEILLEKMILENAGDISAKLSLAVLRTHKREFTAARTLIDELRAENPDSVAVLGVLVDWHLRQNQAEKALAACDAFGVGQDGVQIHRIRCQVLLEMQETAKAVKEIEHILQLAPKDPEVLLSVSTLYLRAGMLEDAISTARQALAIEPDSFETQKQLAILLVPQPKTRQEGLSLLETALAQEPRDAHLRFQKAVLLLQGGALTAEQGVQILDTLVSEYPRLESAWGALIEWYLLNKQTGMAMDTVLRALSNLPNNRTLLIWKARIEAKHAVQVALETLNQLARKYPSDDEILGLRVKLMYQAGRVKEAIHLLTDRQASGEMPVPLKLLLMELLYENNDVEQAGLLYERLSKDLNAETTAMIHWVKLIAKNGQPEEMLLVFKQWYNNHPQGGPTALKLAQELLTEQAHPAQETAENILSAVLKREPDCPEAVFGMAMLYHMTGRKVEAIPYYERTLELTPDNLVAINNLAWILCQDKGEYQKALKLAEEGLLQSPDYLDLIDTRGNIFFALGEYEKAAKDFRVAADRYLDSQPQKAVSLLFLGKSLLQLGQKDLARAEFYLAQNLDERTHGLTDHQRNELDKLLE